MTASSSPGSPTHADHQGPPPTAKAEPAALWGLVRRASPTAVLMAAIAATFVVLGRHGAEQAARGQRVMGGLSPFFSLLRISGQTLIDWVIAHGRAVAWTVTGVAGALGIAGLGLRRRAAAPIVFLAASVSCAAWAQVLLWADRIAVSVALYVAAIVCAAVFGVCCPAPQFGAAWAASPRTAWRRAAEYGLVFSLTCVALLTRIYALTELPSSFVGEIAITMVGSRTSAGISASMEELLKIPVGIVHLVPQLAIFKLFGTSIYSLRLTAAAFGVLTVPLFYWLLRRMAGPLAAVAGTLLFIAAPEQLWWSRAENTYFATLPLLALACVHLGLWMVQRFSLLSVLANALWLPFGRYFYLAGVAMVLYPWILYAHALACVRGAWRRAWYVVPALAAGTALWIVSVSLALAYVNHWNFRFVSPVHHDESIVNRSPDGARVGVWELARLQATSMGRNLGAVLTAAAYRGYGTEWYQRADETSHPTGTNVGVIVLSAVALGYLLGQIYERRAFALLLWFALGLLPALLASFATERRMALVFPALYAIIGVSLAGILGVLRLRTGRLLAGIAAAGISIAMAGVVWTSLASYFSLSTSEESFHEVFRAYQPMFDSSDAIYHNLNSTQANLLAFANADRLADAATPPCYQYVGPREWLTFALTPQCRFTDNAYRFMLPRERIVALRQEPYHPQRISFLLEDVARSQRYLDLLRGLYPDAVEQHVAASSSYVKWAALSVAPGRVDSRRSPTLEVVPDDPDAERLTTQLLAGARLTRVVPAAASGAPAGLVVRGALLLASEDWYRFTIEPACPRATLTVNEHQTGADAPPLPLTGGVHAFELTLPAVAGCALPLHIKAATTAVDDAASSVDSPPLLAPMVATVPQARAPEVVAYDGYGAAQRIAEAGGKPLEIGVDAAGHLTVLFSDDTGFVVQRFDGEGREEARWRPIIPAGHSVQGMAVAPSGAVAISADILLLFYDARGRETGVWHDPPVTLPNIALLSDGRVLGCAVNRASVVRLGPDGAIESELKTFAGGPGQFVEPVALAMNAAGEFVVVQTDGEALLFQLAGTQWPPSFVSSFHMDFTDASMYPQGLTFDGAQRILAGDPRTPRALVYSVAGRRLMAADPRRDLSRMGFGEVRRMASAAHRLYLLDSSARLWSLPR